MSDDDHAPRPAVAAELGALSLARGRPLLAVDADEVLVRFAAPFKTWLEGEGFGFDLSEYRLDTAIRSPGGDVLTREEITPLVWGFIEARTAHQPAAEGAADALARLSEVAQIVVLTNAPARVRAQRVRNLAALGMDYPVVINEGGKGRALNWLAARAEAPVVFVDDSPAQHVSAAKRAPDVARLHLVACPMVAGVVGPAPAAQHHPADWAAAEATARAIFSGG